MSSASKGASNTLKPQQNSFHPTDLISWAKGTEAEILEGETDEGVYYVRVEMWVSAHNEDGNKQSFGGHIEVHEDGFCELQASGVVSSQWYSGFPETLIYEHGEDFIQIIPHEERMSVDTEVPVNNLQFHIHQ